MAHTDAAWSMEDFKLDFLSNNKVNNWQLLKFMFKYPKSFLQLSPVLYTRKKGFIIDINLIIMYFVMVTMFGLTIYLGWKHL